MKQTLHLSHEQRLHMTPQLQQAIRLLQLSTIDLQMEIQNVLESNFMLEIAEEDGEPEKAKESSPESGEPASDAPTVAEARTENEIPEDLPMDSNWDDIYDGSTSYSQSGNDEQADLQIGRAHV